MWEYIPQGMTTGLSPRGRGKRTARKASPTKTRSIPAWAGETGPHTRQYRLLQVYPRVGGGNMGKPGRAGNQGGLSPRGRGKRPAATSQVHLARSIPAWAGETPGRTPYPRRNRVYPRVGGGNGVTVPVHWSFEGLSPRGRGKPPTRAKCPPAKRSIPAWAGETVVLPLCDERLRSIPAWAGETYTRCSGWECFRVYPRVGGGNASGYGNSGGH